MEREKERKKESKKDRDTETHRETQRVPLCSCVEANCYTESSSISF